MAGKYRGETYNRLYNVWYSMKQRCYNPNRKGYHNYGGKNIGVCDEWLNDFEAFYSWATTNGYDVTAPSGKCTLDRIDNSKDYSPNNCRWVTMKEQSNNRSTNRILTYCGESYTLTEWSEIIGIDKDTLWARLYRGWSVEKALTTKIKKSTSSLQIS